jgi:hypothetical protein
VNTDNIEALVVQLATDPFNPQLNFELGLAYEDINQNASAVSFYLRCAEYGTAFDPEIIYTSLIRIAGCLARQSDRKHSMTGALLHAIAYWPERPEAYFLMSQYFERTQQWQEAYSWACIGLAMDRKLDQYAKPLPASVGYEGKYCLLFEKAVSAWWVGRKDEARAILHDLLNNYNMSTEYIKSSLYNLKQIGT